MWSLQINFIILNEVFDPLYQWMEITFRNLRDNNLGTITTNIFGGTSTVSQYLYLSNNQLTKISSDAFDSVQVSYIYLDNNQLEEFPQALLTQNPVVL